MKLSQLAISMIIFTGLITAFGLFYSDLASTYGKDVNSLNFVYYTNPTNITTQNVSYYINVSNDVSDFTKSLELNTTKDLNQATTILTSIGLIVGTVTTILTMPAMLIGFIGDVSNTLFIIGVPIPAWFIAMLGAIITIIVVFKVIEFFTYREV